MESGILGNQIIAVIVDEHTSRAEIAALLGAGITVYTSRPTEAEPLIMEAMPYREPKQQARPKPERHWIQQHPRSPAKGHRR